MRRPPLYVVVSDVTAVVCADDDAEDAADDAGSVV
jgi:hypothetical protein